MLRVWRFAAVLAPHLLSATICGWLGYGPFVRGFLPVAELPEIRDDYALLDSLKARGIKYAEADYWASYRLTLLYNEAVIVVPNNAREDRYAPYRRAFEAAPRFAYIYDRGRSREDLANAEHELVANNAHVEKADIGTLTVFVVTRTKL
jgi:glycosyltransferase involved in cell wall biosynthesis